MLSVRHEHIKSTALRGKGKICNIKKEKTSLLPLGGKIIVAS
jgi:hypothetical protein